MKKVELSDVEVRCLQALLKVEADDLAYLKKKTKQSGQEEDFKELGTELAIVQEIQRKLS